MSVKQYNPRIGDKIQFELEDELFEKGTRVVRAQIIRKYPQPIGKHCTILAFDCIDLDDSSLNYTIPSDERFIQIND